MDKLLIGISAMFLAGILLAGVSLINFFSAKAPLEKSESNFQQFKALEDPSDKCAVPPGQDPVAWREHLSHHPDLYGDCFT